MPSRDSHWGDSLRSRGPEASVDPDQCRCLTDSFIVSADEVSGKEACLCPSRYGFDRVQSECFECSEGKAKATIGNEVCTDCEAGKYQTQPRNEYCEPCPMGLYSSEPGAVECRVCPDKISSYPGSKV